MESTPLPELLTCRISIKNGEPFDACRDKVPPSLAFLYKVSEGYSILRKKIEEHFEIKLPGQWKPTFDIYLKPSNNAKQKQFEIVCQETVALLAQVKDGTGQGGGAMGRPGLSWSSLSTSQNRRHRHLSAAQVLPEFKSSCLEWQHF
ncbi:hypothetical protein PC116_g25316 [Phytophthora cactorum]|nr:hypothetical protein PC116_g25316 [Phytophthora cactorum]